MAISGVDVFVVHLEVTLKRVGHGGALAGHMTLLERSGGVTHD